MLGEAIEDGLDALALPEVGGRGDAFEVEGDRRGLQELQDRVELVERVLGPGQAGVVVSETMTSAAVRFETMTGAQKQ